MLMTTCMYNSKDMDKMAMKQYLVQQKTLPDLSLGEQLAKTGSAKKNVIRAEVLAQILLPDHIPSRSREAETRSRMEEVLQLDTLKIVVVQDSTDNAVSGWFVYKMAAIGRNSCSSSWLAQDGKDQTQG